MTACTNSEPNPKPRLELNRSQPLLEGLWVVISEVISWVTLLITHIRGLLTYL